MNPAGGFSYADYCKQRQAMNAPPTVSSSNEEKNKSDKDNNHIHTYVAMREPDPAKDAQPVAYAYYPQYAYAYPTQQTPVQVVHEEAKFVYMADKSPKLSSPAVQPQPMLAYPTGYTAMPYAYAMPTYPVPVNAPATAKLAPFKPAKAEKEKPAPAEKASKIWVGRTKKQVHEDNIKIAMAEGVYAPNEIVPKGKPDQLFWVVELDGGHTLRTLRTIEEGNVGNGSWKIDHRYGNAYFVVAKEDKKKTKN